MISPEHADFKQTPQNHFFALIYETKKFSDTKIAKINIDSHFLDS